MMWNQLQKVVCCTQIFRPSLETIGQNIFRNPKHLSATPTRARGVLQKRPVSLQLNLSWGITIRKYIEGTDKFVRENNISTYCLSRKVKSFDRQQSEYKTAIGNHKLTLKGLILTTEIWNSVAFSKRMEPVIAIPFSRCCRNHR